MPSPVTLLTTMRGRADRDLLGLEQRASGSSQRSAFVRTSAGVAPLSHARVR